MARPQPSLRFADGGSFITRWAEGVMRPNATAKRLREIEAPPPPPPPTQPPAPPPPPPNPRVTKDNPAGIRFQDGGHVPGTGEGDKIPAKYEPGEFVVSNDMIDDNPGLREGLSSMRAETLAARGKTVEEADAGATRHMGSLRAADGWDPLDRMAKSLTGQNSLPPRSPMGNMAEDLVRNARPAPAPFDGSRNFSVPGTEVPRGPSSSIVPGPPAPIRAPLDASLSGPSSNYPRTFDVPHFSTPSGYPSSSLAGGPAAAAAEAAHGQRVNPTLRPNQAAFHGDGRYGAPANGPSNASVAALNEANAATRAASGVPGAPGMPDAPAGPSRLRTAGGALGSVGLGIGAGLAGGAAVERARGIGAPGAPSAAGPETALDRQVNQIPGNQDGSLRAPAAQNYDFFKDNEVGRNIGNTLNAAAPLQALGGLARGATAAGAAVKAGIAGRATRAGVGAAGLADDAVIGASFALQNGASEAPNPANSLRIDPNGRTAGPPKSAMNTPVDPNSIRRQDRPGQSPLFTNMPDGGMLGNDALMARGQPSAQNQAVMDSFPEGSLRGAQAAQYDREVANAQGINALQQRIHGTPEGSIKNGLMTRTPDQQLRDAKVSASSIHKRTAELGRAELKRLDNASSLRTKADAARYDTDSRSASERYKSDNSLRGDQARALGDRRGTNNSAAQKQQEMLMYGEAFRAAGGDPVRAAEIAAGAGLDPARFTGMAAAGQARGAANDKSTRGVFSGMFGKDGEQQEAQAHHQAQQMFPDWNRMSPDAQAQASTEVVQATKMLQNMNNQRNVGWGKKLGFDRPAPEMSQLPDMNGATLGDVGMFEGAVTPGVSRNDTKITLPGGGTRYLRAGELTEQQMRILENRGAKPAKD